MFYGRFFDNARTTSLHGQTGMRFSRQSIGNWDLSKDTRRCSTPCPTYATIRRYFQRCTLLVVARCAIVTGMDAIITALYGNNIPKTHT